MYKQFVSLTSNQSPSKNPYEIRTYMGECFKTPGPEWPIGNCINRQRNCEVPQNSTLAKVLTLQDEIRKIHQRTQENVFLRPFCKKCKYEDRYSTCVVPQRKPEELKQHAIMCEKCLKIKHEMNERARDVGDLYSDHKSLVRLKDPDVQEDEEIGESEDGDGILPELASPECSMEYIYVPPTNLLELNRPKSGLFINETERPKFSPSDEIPYSTYNPRVLQEQFDAQSLKKIDLIPGKNAKDLWTWNVGLQKKESELDRIFIEAAVQNFECTNQELVAYRIPKDLEKTFSANITLGTKAVQPQPLPRKKSHYQRPLEMACLYIAFVEGFRLNADFWAYKHIDNIINMAEKLIEKSVKMNYKSPDNDYDIIPQILERQAALNIKTHFAGPLKSEPNIYKALSLYFSKYNTCILCSHKLYLLIWKRCKNFFYVYDPNGRSESCTRDFENGKSALLSTHFIEHLVHFIVNISQTNLEDDFKLYEIFLTSYGKIINPLPNKPFPKTSHKQWAVVNESYAVIPGCNNGLSQPNTSAIDNPSMLISVMAILYNHIECGNSWKPDQIDELIRLGTAYYKSLRRKLKLKDSQHVTISDLPDKYVLGTFKASLKKYPYMYTGIITDLCKKFIDSLLASNMQELFDNKWEAALLQIDNSILAIWRGRELFYVYDPFRRGKAGQVLDPDDYRTQGAAILQIHANIESFLRVVYEKAIKLRRGAKFFIHAINVGCIKPIMDGKPRKLRYPKLKLTPETYVPIEKLPEQGQGDMSEEDVLSKNVNSKKSKKDKKSKNKKNKIEKVCSIESLNEKERVFFVANPEVVEPMLQEIICDIIDKFPETILGRPKLYKSAGRVLLRSDKEYLENLKYLVKHEEDCDNMEMSFKTEQEPNTPLISLEEELQLPSNFQSLPDGTWIIFGSQLLHRMDDEQFKLKGLLSSIVCTALSAKYKISTWSNKLIDYALESVDNFGEDFQSYQYALGALLHRHIPKLLLGDSIYKINVQKVLKSDVQKSLRQVLIETLVNFNRLLVVCQRYCCVIIKRYNFLYMFSGFPVNAVGYRKFTTGPGCMLRFLELDSVIRRIEFGCNPQGCDITDYVVIPVKVRDITSEPMGRYRTWPINIGQQMYNQAFEEKLRIEESKKSKMRFLNEELNKEHRRIKDFQVERDRGVNNSSSKIKSSEETTIGEWKIEPNIGSEGDEEFLVEEEAEEECMVEIKHDFGTELDIARDEEYKKPRPILYGYRLREKDLLYKIQGSKALEDRTNCIYHEIKPCLFSSALAILYAILKSLHEWTSHRIDQVIDSTLILSDRIDDMSNSQDRIIKNISVDDYVFDIWLKVYEPLGLIGNLEKQLERALSENKYLIFQTANCSYALSRDEYYHLFDSYPSMEIINGEGEELLEEEEADDRKHKSFKSIKRYAERNTASWVLFADIKSLIKYMNQRSCSITWKEDREYKFMAMEIISFKKAPQSAFVLQLLTGMQSCNMQDEQETSVCAHNESIAWLEHCLPIWSRLNRRNAAGRYRGMAVTKLKKYDIEIDQRLWSLWGNLHPQAPVFGVSTRGKQYMACCVISLCAAYLYRLVDWSPQLLDSIIVNGDCYMQQSIQNIKCEDYQFDLENLDVECLLDSVKFDVHIEMVAYGKLYSRPHYNIMNLAEALMYFFNNFQFGILQSFKKCLAIGYMPDRDGGYFMFDCQSHDHPLFPKGQGASYVLRTKYLQILLYCIVVTLNIPYFNVQFTLHKVDLVVKDQEDDEGDK